MWGWITTTKRIQAKLFNVGATALPSSPLALVEAVRACLGSWRQLSIWSIRHNDADVDNPYFGEVSIHCQCKGCGGGGGEGRGGVSNHDAEGCVGMWGMRKVDNLVDERRCCGRGVIR